METNWIRKLNSILRFVLKRQRNEGPLSQETNKDKWGNGISFLYNVGENFILFHCQINNISKLHWFVEDNKSYNTGDGN